MVGDHRVGPCAVRPPALFATIARAAEARIGEFGPQGLDSLRWAFTTAGAPAPALLAAIERAIDGSGATWLQGFLVDGVSPRKAKGRRGKNARDRVVLAARAKR